MKKLLLSLFLLGISSAAVADTAIFALGCFWCGEAAFMDIPGVISVVSGYTGGQVENPSYEQVSAGGTGHRESVQVDFDPAQISYAALLKVFWHNTDPFDGRGQFCDKGDQYRSTIFVATEEQRKLAEASIAELPLSAAQKANIKTEILDAKPFYPAEEYHQDYYKKNPARYSYYRWGCGRDARLKEIWGESNVENTH